MTARHVNGSIITTDGTVVDVQIRLTMHADSWTGTVVIPDPGSVAADIGHHVTVYVRHNGRHLVGEARIHNCAIGGDAGGRFETCDLDGHGPLADIEPSDA